MRNYLALIALFLVTTTQAQIMLPAYQAIQYRRNTFLPTITTSTITAITPSKAVSGGTITSDGGAPVSVRGICWSTTPGPTIALTTKTNDGIGIGTFVSNLVLLTPNTTYYIRAYATNIVGTAYGNELSFTTNFAVPLAGVPICGNVWSSKNLDVTTYSDGTPIPQCTSGGVWQSLTTGAWCYYNNDPANQPIYGKLYNWYAVVGIYNAASLTNPALRKSIAPIGWHRSSDSEWYQMVQCLGGGSVAGGKLKETGLTHWQTPNTGASNSTFFTALPGGFRNDNGNFFDLGLYGHFITEREISGTIPGVFNVNEWYIRHITTSIGSVPKLKTMGYSVRIIMD